MGRRLRGAALRAKKRSQQAAQEMLDKAGTEAEEQVVTEQSNEELFVLDTTAVMPSKKQQDRKHDKKANHRHQKLSKTEEGQIQKLLETHKTQEKLQKLVQLGQKRSMRARRKGRVLPNFDLWDDDSKEESGRQGSDERDPKRQKVRVDPGVGGSLAGITPMHIQKLPSKLQANSPSNKASATTSSKPVSKPPKSTVSVDVAHSGQSYNPDAVQHQIVMKEAVQVELKRQQAEKQKDAPISAGMSEETRALLVGDSDTSDDESNDSNASDDEESGNTGDQKVILKKSEKMTRAQRNKQKRLRAEKFELEQRKRQKKIQNAVAEAKTIAKRLRKEEQEAQQKKLELQKLKDKTKNARVKGKNVIQQLANENPLEAPTLPVALPSELRNGSGGGGASLRTIKAKGSLITDRMTSLMDRGLATKKQLKKRKRVEGKRRKAKVRVHGKGHDTSKESGILG